jgi:hypothetical protein
MDGGDASDARPPGSVAPPAAMTTPGAGKLPVKGTYLHVHRRRPGHHMEPWSAVGPTDRIRITPISDNFGSKR